MKNGFLFSWDICFNAFFYLIWHCPRSKPGSVGGETKGYNGQVSVRIDPWNEWRAMDGGEGA